MYSMAQIPKLPCDGDGVCMVCKQTPPAEATVMCMTCITPWHLPCLGDGAPETLSSALQWECPDCRPVDDSAPSEAFRRSEDSGSLVAMIRAIEYDSSLTEQEKARKRQELVGGSFKLDNGVDGNSKLVENKEVLNIFDESMNCSICMQLPERPVTTPCGHNFCLKCFQKWIGGGKRTCATCRSGIPSKMASQPLINTQLAMAIRLAKVSKSKVVVEGGPSRPYHYIHNQDRPDKAFTTERAKKAGKANACSGKIFVTVPPDHFGPITAEHDPERGQGVLVGETWEGRMECRQWGVHLPPVAGIAGQSGYGAQSVVLSGGYQDDEDHGEWFLYTGSGGRDLSGNKRTSKEQSFDQKFEKLNEALRVSCRKGYPVRVVRAYKEKRSSYAPEIGYRYDGIYRIEKCWSKNGIQGHKVCRYLFVRCDNEPAPWTSDDYGDRPRPLPEIGELKDAVDLTERKGVPSWDYDEDKRSWLWKMPPPYSKKQMESVNPEDGAKIKVRRQMKNVSVKEKLLKEFSCSICSKVLASPLTTPCGHNFCKACVEGVFSGQSFFRKRTSEGGRSLRAQKNVMKCPLCPNDIADFLQNPQVNRELMGVIESLQRQVEQVEENAEELSDKTDENLENQEDGTEETNLCESTEEVLEEIKDSELNQQPCKLRKCDEGICVLNTEPNINDFEDSWVEKSN